jgi:hypothetical protein
MVLILLMFASAALAAEPMVTGPGFWTGLTDGLFSLFKLVLSPLLDVSPAPRHFGTSGYIAGYSVGMLIFLSAAGAVASEDWGADEVRLETDSNFGR